MNRVFLFLLLAGFLTPIQAQIRILPLGNSITQGKVGLPSYRQALWKMFEQADMSVDFVGSLDAPFLCEEDVKDGFDPDHEGHWGFRIDQILSHTGADINCRAASKNGGLSQWLQNYTPDIALVHLGTNDLFQKPWYQSSESVLSTTLAELDTVIQILRLDNPNVQLYLAQLIPVNDASTNKLVLSYNQSLKSFSLRRQSLQSPIVLIDQYSGFNWQTDTHDGVHPNAVGAQKMAFKWFQAITNPLSAAARNAQLSQMPSTQQVWIPETLRSANSLSLIDTEGKVRYRGAEVPSRLDVSNLESGLYYLAFGGETSMVRKIYL